MYVSDCVVLIFSSFLSFMKVFVSQLTILQVLVFLTSFEFLYIGLLDGI